MHSSTSAHLVALGLTVLLVGCGGGDATDSSAEAQSGDSRLTAQSARKSEPAVRAAPAASGPTGQERTAAARKTANSTTNACMAQRPFYWEIGAASGRLTSGQVDSSSNPTTYNAATVVDLGSASKWLYSAYIAERRGGVMTDMDKKLLTLRSGYRNLSQCYPSQTVNGCFYYLDNDLHEPEVDGKFSYNGGHLQKHATNIGLGPMTRQELATEVKTVIGSDMNLRYDLAMPSGGGTSTAASYGAFLRRMMTGQLKLGALLGADAVCTNPATCPTALHTPTPPDESWHYSYGHWVEDDPVTGDGSFSSPGTKGFYPWIDANKAFYGILVRQVDAGNWQGSVDCGRLIRKAWKTGQVQ